MTSLLSLKNILNFPSYAEQKPVLKMTYKAPFDQPPQEFNALFFSLSTTVPLASLTVLKHATLAFISGPLHLPFLSEREHTLDTCPAHFPTSSGLCSKVLFSARPILTSPLNMTIDSFSPFPALFFYITLLPPNMLSILLICMDCCLPPNSKHMSLWSSLPLGSAAL